MAEITTGAPIQLPTAAPTPVLQKIENTVFAFLQAHYAKLLAVLVGFATSHFGLLGKFL
jgi:hypothetical protein